MVCSTANYIILLFVILNESEQSAKISLVKSK